jgi:hypothetical protein
MPTPPHPAIFATEEELEEYRKSLEMKKPRYPEWPLDRITADGAIGTSGICPNCHSTVFRRPLFFGKRYCCNGKCKYNKESIPKYYPKWM